MTVSAQSARGSRWRRIMVVVATSTALVVPVAAVPALLPTAAGAPVVRAENGGTPTPAYWFGDPVVDNVMLGGESLFASLTFDHPRLTHPLPFHSVVRGKLYDCRGRVVHTRYATLYTEKFGRRPWRTQSDLNLSVPRAGGPFSRWRVTVLAKGRKAVHFDVTDGGQALQLGCEGQYRRDRALEWWPQYDPKEPINARFGKPVAALLRNRAGSFGRVVGPARVGAKVRVVGARDAQNVPYGCGFGIDITFPRRPDMRHVEGTDCDTSIRVPRFGYFRPDAGGRTVKAPTRGKVLTVSVGFHHRGHDYRRYTTLGRIR